MRSWDTMTVKQFSQMTGVSQYTLRYYDHIGLFSPEGRGENQYRYYIPRQSVTLKYINTLVNLGVPLAKIKELAKRRTPDDLRAMLRNQARILDNELYRLQGAYQVINERLLYMEEGMLADLDDITVEERERTPVILGPVNNWAASDSVYEPLTDFHDYAAQNGVNPGYPIGGYFDSAAGFFKNPGQPSRFISMNPHGGSEIAAGNYLVAYKTGFYGKAGDAAERISSFIKERRYELKGPVYEIYLLDEICVSEPDRYVSQILVAAAPR
ncbi:MAG: MerR family transcriptional regulator [Firmicutes bacterium]|nr:MerR family transcriptional regulator [Bacillota bacterium]